MPALSRANVRHLASLVRLGRNPAATVYDSLGGEFFLSPLPAGSTSACGKDVGTRSRQRTRSCGWRRC